MEAGGKPFLWHHVQRLRQTGLPVIIATTDDGSEAPIEDFCVLHEIPCFKGDEQDVLKRFYDCALANHVSTVIRVTSDCPLIDPGLIKAGLQQYLKTGAGTYYSNTSIRSYPRGMDYEIFSFSLLKEAYEKALDASDREHVTPFIWKNKMGHVSVLQDVAPVDNSEYRLTLDTEEDRLLLKKLIEEYSANTLHCGQIVEIMKAHPSLAEINRHVEQKKI